MMNCNKKRVAAALLCLVLALGTLFAFAGCKSGDTTTSSGSESQTETVSGGTANDGTASGGTANGGTANDGTANGGAANGGTVSTGTQTGEATLVGTWEGTLEMSSALNASFATDATMAKYLHVDSLPITVRYAFEESGSYSLKIDGDSVHTAFDAVRSTLRDGMTAYLEEMAKQNGMTLDELMTQNGTTLDKMLDDSLSDDALGLDELAATSESGTWTAENGVLTCKSTGETEALKYELTADELRLTGLASGATDADGLVFPMVFRRVS